MRKIFALTVLVLTTICAPSSQAQVACPGAPPSIISVGIHGRVTFTDGTPTRLRSSPSTNANVLMNMPEGFEFDVIGGPTCNSPYIWWQLRTGDGTVGWAVEGDFESYYIEPVPASGSSQAGLQVTSGTDPTNLGDLSDIPQTQGTVPLTVGEITFTGDHPAAKSLSENVKVYAQPSANSDQIGSLSPNAVYPVVGKNGNSLWLQLDFAVGRGWVCRQFLEDNGLIFVVPVTDNSAENCLGSVETSEITDWQTIFQPVPANEFEYHQEITDFIVNRVMPTLPYMVEFVDNVYFVAENIDVVPSQVGVKHEINLICRAMSIAQTFSDSPDNSQLDLQELPVFICVWADAIRGNPLAWAQIAANPEQFVDPITDPINEWAWSLPLTCAFFANAPVCPNASTPNEAASPIVPTPSAPIVSASVSIPGFEGQYSYVSSEATFTFNYPLEWAMDVDEGNSIDFNFMVANRTANLYVMRPDWLRENFTQNAYEFGFSLDEFNQLDAYGIVQASLHAWELDGNFYVSRSPSEVQAGSRSIIFAEGFEEGDPVAVMCTYLDGWGYILAVGGVNGGSSAEFEQYKSLVISVLQTMRYTGFTEITTLVPINTPPPSSSQTDNEGVVIPDSALRAIEDELDSLRGAGNNVVPDEWKVISAQQISTEYLDFFWEVYDEAWCIVIQPPVVKEYLAGNDYYSHYLVKRKALAWRVERILDWDLSRDKFLERGCTNW